ncbi:hypothetical protein D0T66_12760 [Dysgonomonas sp. 25]|nr:hypothetical protein [Dysgonomonas sp. 25]
MLLGITSVKAQCNLPYKDLKAFNNDTTAFFVHNFINRADCYKGKTLHDVVKDMQLPIKWGQSILKAGITNYSLGVKIGVNTNDESLRLINNNKTDNTIYIYWENEVYIDLQHEADIIYGKKPYTDYLDIYKNAKIKKLKALAPKEEKYLEQVKSAEKRNEFIRQQKLIEEVINR